MRVIKFLIALHTTIAHADDSRGLSCSNASFVLYIFLACFIFQWTHDNAWAIYQVILKKHAKQTYIDQMFCYRAHVKAIHVRTGARVYHVMKQVTTIVNAAKTTLVLTARTVSFFWNCFSLSPVLKNRMRIGPAVLIRRL